MIKNFFRLLHEPGKSIVLINIRERLLRTMLFSSFVIGTLLYGLAIIPAFRKGLYPTIFIYTFTYIGIILITSLRRLPYRLRTICWLGVAYILGTLNLAESGFNVDAGLFFIAFIAMAILLLDLPGGLGALLLSCITISIFGFENVSENIRLSMSLPQSDPLLWIIGGIIFLLMGILLIYSLTMAVRGLEVNLAKTTLQAEELEQINRSLRLSEARYRTLVETSPGLVVLLDLDGIILKVNQRGLELFGYESQEEVIGKNISIFILPDDQQRVIETVEKALQEDTPEDFECRGRKKNNETFFVEFNAALVRDETGKPQAIITIGKDISARKEMERLLEEAREKLEEKVVETTYQLQQTTSRFEELVKRGPTVIFSYRASDHAVTYMSENVANLIGYEAANFIQNENFWDACIHPEDKARLYSRMELLGESESYRFDYRFLHKNGTYRWLREEMVLLRDEQSNPSEFVGSLLDITELKKNQANLSFTEDRYHSLYESMMDAYASVDMEGRIRQFNWAFLQMLGYAAEELHQLTYQDLTPEKWHAVEEAIVQDQILPRGYSDTYEKEYIRKDGTIIPVELRIVLIRDEQGNPAGMWAIIRDIRERKRTEENLRESEQRFRELLDNSMQGVIVFQDRRILYANQTVLDALGYTEGELRSLRQAEILRQIHPDDHRIFWESLQNPLEEVPSRERYPIRVLRKDGKFIWLEVRTLPIIMDGNPAVLLTGINVTEIREAQSKLEESAKIRETILNASDALVVLVDTQGDVIITNEKFAERRGKKVKALIGTNFSDFLTEDETAPWRNLFDQLIKSGKPVITLNSRGESWFENGFYPIRDESGNVVSVAVFARDITEQRRMTEALRASEEQYRTLAEASRDVIFIIGRDDRLVYVNTYGAEYQGRKAWQLVGKPWWGFFPADTRENQAKNILHVFKTGEAISTETDIKFPHRTVWFHTLLVPLKDAAGEVNAVLGVSRDITERKQYEIVLQQAREQLEERVAERTSELSASQEKLRLLTAQIISAQEEERRAIARDLHDEAGQALITLKYALVTIQGELPKSKKVTMQRVSDSMKVIDQTMVHIRALAHSLRPPVLDIGGIDLSLKEYCQEIYERTRIPISYEGMEIPGLPDEIGISLFRFVQEALTNILKHAMASEVKVRMQYKEGEISISVSDNGRGMDPTAEASGLGLLGIKERLGLLNGRLAIHSRRGQGAKLTATVPWVPSQRE
jgi:PAS domain S-box-containing protein